MMSCSTFWEKKHNQNESHEDVRGVQMFATFLTFRTWIWMQPQKPVGPTHRIIAGLRITATIYALTWSKIHRTCNFDETFKSQQINDNRLLKVNNISVVPVPFSVCLIIKTSS